MANQLVGRFVPRSSSALVVLNILAALANSMTLGYDGSMMNGLNILPSFLDYISLNTATLSASTGIVWVGGAVAGLFSGFVIDKWGRKSGMFWAAILACAGVTVQSAAQNAAMFIIGRFIVGVGIGLSSVACPTYVAEISQLKWRAFSLGFYYAFWYGGGLLAAGVTYGTAKIPNSWAWRFPSILQVVPSVLCIVILPLLPESPRWLMYQDRYDEALEALAITMADGDVDNSGVVTQFAQIRDTIAFEKAHKTSNSWIEAVKTPENRKRTILACSVALIGNLSGSGIISYYLGTMLSQAGITSTDTQLEINVILSVWCFACAIVGTCLADKIGRKPLAAGSLGVALVFLYLVGILTKYYGTSTSTSGIYGTIASIFLFQGIYSFGWTTLLVMYPPEVFNYSLRANGMSIYTFLSNGAAIIVTFAFPFALKAIGWKTYVINASWDVLEVIFVVYYWVETKGRTLEEIDLLIDGEEHFHLEATAGAPGIKLNDTGAEVTIEKV